jgi:uncharacterized protein YjiS (DUF1127 family)
MNLSDDTYLISGDQHVGVFLPSMLTRLHRIAAFWHQRRTRAREMADLYRFNDRELWDIGLNRSDLRAIERGTFRRE